MKKTLFLFCIAWVCTVWGNQPNFLFSQTAPEATITKLHRNNYLLTLNEIPDEVNFFAAQSGYKAGILPLLKFVGLWSNGKNKYNFVNKPPNAIISLVTEKDKQQIFAAVISNPGFDKGKVTYQISVLDGNYLYAGKFKYVALLFDNIPWNPAEL